MKATFYLLALALVAIIVLWIVNKRQQANLLKGKIVSKESLLRRSRWAIALGGVGIIPFIITVSDNGARSELLNVRQSIHKDTLRIVSRGNVPRRYFVDGLYPREELDVLEEDFGYLKSWADSVCVEARSHFKILDPIDGPLLCAPTPKSKIDNPELTYYRESLLEAIEDYNRDVSAYAVLGKHREFLDLMSWFVTIVMPILLFFSLLLQFNVAFWSYRGAEDKNMS